MTQHLPRLMIALMFFSIIGMGVAIKTSQANAQFVAEAFAGTTFEQG